MPKGTWASTGGRAVRAGPRGELVQAVEPDVVGLLFPAAGADGRIPKPGGKGVRLLGVPAVADRIARPWRRCPWSRKRRRSSTATPTATGRARARWTRWRHADERFWHGDWVVDLDRKGFFDNLDHDLALKVVAQDAAAVAARHAGCPGSRQSAALGVLAAPVDEQCPDRAIGACRRRSYQAPPINDLASAGPTTRS
jgi:hypothetical protein